MSDRPIEQLAAIADPTSADVLEATLPVAGWTFPEELVFLWERAKTARTIVEFGVWQGRTTIALAMGTPGRVFACDHWRGSADELNGAHDVMRTPEGRAECFGRAMRNLAPFVGLGRVVVVHADHSATVGVVEAIAGVEPADLVFVDGAHDKASAARDILSASRLTRLGGTIAGHDYNWPGVRAAVDAAFGSFVKRGPGSLWYVKQGTRE